MVLVPPPANIWNISTTMTTSTAPHSQGDCHIGRFSLLLPLPLVPLLPRLNGLVNGLPLLRLLFGFGLLPLPGLREAHACTPW